LDIESMGTNPSNALVLTIGAARFDFGEHTSDLIACRRLNH